MVAGCGNKCVKYIYFAFNFLFFIFGALILGLALWVRFDNNFQTKISDAMLKSNALEIQIDQMYIALYVAAAIGGLLCLLGFLGCCGACCESVCLLGLFFTAVMVLFIAEIAAAIYIFVKKDVIKDELGTVFKQATVDKYFDDEQIQKGMDKLQTSLSCCGSTGCGDWGSNTIPDSCQCADANDLTVPGCSTKLFDAVSNHIVIVAGVAIAVLAIELLAMIFACILCNGIRTSSYDYY